MKERLIGAAVLVALGVWLIPWVLDGQNEQTETNENALRLPAPEEPLPMRTETIRIGGDDEPEKVTPPVLAAPSGPAVAEAVVDDSADLLAAVEEPVAAESRVASPAAAAPSPVPVPAAEPPKPAPKPAAAERTAQKGDWVVQLGSFGEEANARRLAQRVATFGHRADVSTVRASGRTMYRVRVGAFDSRPKAEATASALSAHGFVAQVVAAD